MNHRSPMRARVALAAVLAFVGSLLIAPAANAADPISVTVRILRVVEVACDEGDLVPCPDDPYASVSIAGQPRQESGYVNNPDPPDIRPNWEFTRTVPAATTTVPISIQIWDDEDSSGDDLLDACDPGDDNIDITLDLDSGGWTGDTAPSTGFCSGGNVAVTFDVLLDNGGDFDGDGISDGIELLGIRNADGALVLNLAALGSDPCRPSIITEIDYMEGAADGHTHRPIPAALAEAQAMFDRAPVAAPPDCPYPGNHPATGIDFLSVVDDALPEQALLDWSNGGQAVRDANFSADLRPYLHYSLWTHQRPAPDTGSSGLCCSDSGRDTIVSLGGWTNNVGSVREQAGTHVHELGHALRLGHGGDTGDALNNCKPNYLSAMSYLFQTGGIPDPTLPAPNVDTDNNGVADARLRLDFSPDTLAPLDESVLNENLGIQGGTDGTIWTNDGGLTSDAAPGNGPINWNGNTDAGGAPIIENPVSVDVNDFGFVGCDVAQLSTLTGFDDWANIKFQAVLSTDKGGAVSGGPELDWATAQRIAAFIAAAAKPDLSVSLAAIPDPVLTGSDAVFTATVRNTSPMPAEDVSVTFTAPAGTSAATTTATFPLIAPGALVTADFTVAVPCSVADGTVLSGSAAVASNPADNDPSDNTASAQIEASNPPPVISNLTRTPTTLWPANHKMRDVALDYTVEDNCGVPTVSLSVTSNQTVNGNGDGNTSPDWVVISPKAAQLRAERTGNDPAGRVYTLTVGAVDSANGSSTAPTQVTVPHNR
ncbi:NEW3 domain-containing protein [Microbacterium sp.]|uniref:NEW3 domain-containing protein n=1 Tax=Microbacterium sp. TaxID=51671 RepID=UPI002E328E02|nr:NEW3 domain-containing protein [Microbacterium sp.]HEX5729076.1 NEW3 domain-containing protein [Microbacterium sp.]